MARGCNEIGKATLAWAIVIAPRIRCTIFEHEGLVLDTRFVAPHAGEAKPNVCLYVLLDGSLETFGAVPMRHEAPCAVVFTEAQMDGERGHHAMPLRVSGAPHRAIELHLARTDVLVEPSPIALDETTWRAARLVGARANPDDEAIVGPLGALLERLAVAGVLAPAAVGVALEPTSAPFIRLWAALRPMIERLYLTATVQELSESTGASQKQVDRVIRAFVAASGFVGDGWRPATRYLRLKLSVLLLSAEGASIGDVARLASYGSTDAMARAYRDARMLPPSEIQSRLRGG